MVRIEAGSHEGTQLILTSPDAASNPYLVIAACLAAGLDGIEKKRMPYSNGKVTNAETLPANLEEAIYEFKKDAFVQNVVGEQISTKLTESKKKEWDEYCKQVSDWEIKQYLYRI